MNRIQALFDLPENRQVFPYSKRRQLTEKSRELHDAASSEMNWNKDQILRISQELQDTLTDVQVQTSLPGLQLWLQGKAERQMPQEACKYQFFCLWRATSLLIQLSLLSTTTLFLPPPLTIPLGRYITR